MKSIKFNTEEVKRVLEGNKTQFRKVVKPQPEFKNNHFYSQNETTGFSKELFILDKCPYKVGDEIFVKESFVEHDSKIFFKATHQKILTHFIGSVKWHSASRMKQEQSRLTLRIKDIKIEKENNLWVWVVEFELLTTTK